ncbi:MAG TPA: (d)CMP kinase [Thermoanaerobacterales bacterium]|nr:(d)CMP kinase [Thermoanaerobacterales bacterium]
MNINIAIDGPAGAGKSTVAKILAKKLKMKYIDTGAMYRAVTLKALENKKETEQEIIDIAKKIDIRFAQDKIYVDGEDVTQKIRDKNIDNKVSDVAKIEEVRKIMLKSQQQLAKAKNVIMDGRDIGTTVMPHADFKFFLTADLTERAKRRYKQVSQIDKNMKFEEIKNEIQARDTKDKKRKCSPLLAAQDAIIIDTTDKSIEQVIDEIMSHVKGVGSDAL